MNASTKRNERNDRKERPPSRNRYTNHSHHHHIPPQITIPSVESITIDFSAVKVYRNRQLDVGSTATVYEGKYSNEKVAVKLCKSIIFSFFFQFKYLTVMTFSSFFSLFFYRSFANLKSKKSCRLCT